MLAAAIRLSKILNDIPPKLKSFSEEEASEKAPGKWSKKEILGHLIDSAANNHQRFVRMQAETGLSLPQYQQDDWVKLQKYQERNWKDIVTLWESYNLHLLHILKNIDETRLMNTATFPQYGAQTLQFIIDDYVDHMEHHLNSIINK